MSDHVLAIVGVILAIIMGISPYRWPKVPRWITDIGLGIACVLIGIAIAPYVNEVRTPVPPAPTATMPPVTPQIAQAPTSKSPVCHPTQKELADSAKQQRLVKIQLDQSQAQVSQLQSELAEVKKQRELDNKDLDHDLDKYVKSPDKGSNPAGERGKAPIEIDLGSCLERENIDLHTINVLESERKADSEPFTPQDMIKRQEEGKF